jgi:hypothetical protein
MRSSIRFGLVAVGTLALLTIGFVTFRARLEQKVQAQRPTQVAGCDASRAASTGPNANFPGRTAANPCLVISSFRQNGPNGTGDEFVEIFNASTVDVTVSSLSNDPGGVVNGIGVYVSAGQGFHPQFGTASNQSKLWCQINGNTIIKGRRWFLCGGKDYSLNALGTNSQTAPTHSVPDAQVGVNGQPLISGGFAPINDIPDDAGMALLDVGTDIVTQCQFSTFQCSTGFNYSAPGIGNGQDVVLDKVGFNPYGPGSPKNTGGGYPGNVYPSLARQYCEGTCLQPVGDASVITLPAGAPCPASVPPNNPGYSQAPLGAQYDTGFPVKLPGTPVINAQGIPTTVNRCYGESGQYKIERRRSEQTFNAASGDIHKDSWNSMFDNQTLPQNTFGACQPGALPGGANCGNADDYIMDAPNPATANVGLTETGVSGISSVLGAAWPHSCDRGLGCTTIAPSGAPPIIGQNQFTQAPFDNCAGAVIPCVVDQLGPRNAERRYAQDPNILGTANDPFGTFILRFRYTNNTGSATAGQRWRIDDISTNCGGQAGTTFSVIGNPAGTGIATQEARNLRGPDFSILPAQSPTPTCQGEGADAGKGVYTALMKAVNHYGEIVVDSTGTARIVAGTVLEDTFVGPAGTATPATGSLQPFGGGSNSTFVVNTTAVGNQTLNIAPPGPLPIVLIGDGVNGGTGSFGYIIPSASTFRIAFKFGVVRSGRFKLLLGREVSGVSATPQQ